MNKALDGVLRARSFRWGVNTAVSLVVNLGLTVGLHEGLGIDPAIAYAVALLTVFLMNFVLFRFYVFVQTEPMPVGTQFMAYTTSAIGFRLTEYAAFLLLHSVLGVHYILTIFVVQGISFVAKFFVYGRWIFRAHRRA